MKKKLNILIVEDDFISRTLLKEMLAPFGQCRTAADGAEAVEVLRESFEKPGGRYDLVCLDIMMPHKNGHQVLQEMRLMEKRKGLHGKETTKVVMVSGLNDAKNMREALVVGQCEAYLTKPVSKRRLEEKLRHLRLIETSP